MNSPITLRVLPPSGLYLRRRLAGLCNDLAGKDSATASRNEIIDGFLLRAQKAAGRTTGKLIDIPHRIAWAAYVSSDHYGDDTGFLLSAYLALPMRDNLLVEELGVFDNIAPLPATLLNVPRAYFTDNFAGFAATSVLGNADRADNFITCAETIILYQSIDRALTGVGAWDRMRGGDGLVSVAYIRSTRFANGTAKDGVIEDDPLTGLDNRTSVVVTEPWLQGRIGRGMCGRISPPSEPGIPPTGAQQQFRDAQAPWCTAIAERLAPGVVRWLVAIHTVVQNNVVEDYYGSRSAYIGTFLAVNDPEIATPGLFLVGDFQRVNAADGVLNRQPELVDGDPNDHYDMNNHHPYHLAHLDENLSLVYGSFHVRRDGTLYFTAEVHRVLKLTGAQQSLVRVADAVEDDNPAVYFTGCEGLASDEQGTAVAITRHPATSDNEFGVVLITASSVTTERYSVDFVRYGGAVGQSISCVEFIGNGKYAFPVSSANPVPSAYLADWRVAVYDSVAKTMAAGGQVEPARNVSQGINRYTGRMCCVQEELADAEGNVTRYATVLATIGPYGLVVDRPGNESGRTYISYDSCQTWRKVIDFGSPRGVMYGANPAFDPPHRQLLRRTTP